MGVGREGGMGNLSVDTILRFLLVVRVSDLTPPDRAAIGQNLLHSHLFLPPHIIINWLIFPAASTKLLLTIYFKHKKDKALFSSYY